MPPFVAHLSNITMIAEGCVENSENNRDTYLYPSLLLAPRNKVHTISILIFQPIGTITLVF
jgi:hypothetical protein